MNKIYYLSTCSTCKKIMSALNISAQNFELQDIKFNKITAEQLDEMQSLAGSYEALFTKRSMKYKSMNLKEKTLTESDYKSLILDEYTFLKRPVAIVKGEVFVGNSKKNVEELSAALS